MKLTACLNPSHMCDAIVSVVKRFPLTVLGSIGLTACLILSIEDPSLSQTQAFYLIKGALLCALLAITSLLADIIHEFRAPSRKRRLWGYALALAFTVLYGFWLPEHEEHMRQAHALSYGILLFSLHLGIALSPWKPSTADHELWQFNAHLFLRYVLSVINVIIIFVGLSLALLSIDMLFNLDVDEERYGQLWVVCTFFIHPLLFLGGIPRAETFETFSEFPKPLHFSLRYIALPLTVLYLLILYTYAGKILLQRSWPDGWVAMPVFILSVVSMLTYLLSFPLRQSDLWAQFFHRWIYLFLLPLSILLMLSIEERISTYGFTEHRYIALALAIWLLLISLAHILRLRKKPLSIGWIPASLLIFSLASIGGGPISAKSVSIRSQLERLKIITASIGGFEDGQLVSSSQTVSHEDYQNIESAIKYLIQWHGSEPLHGILGNFFKEDTPEETFAHLRRWEQRNKLMDYLGISSEESLEYRWFNLNRNTPTPTFGHSHTTRSITIGKFQEDAQFNDFTFHYEPASQQLSIKHLDTPIDTLDLSHLVDTVFPKNHEPLEDTQIIHLPFSGNGWTGVIIFTHLEADLNLRRVEDLNFILSYTPTQP